MRKPTTERRRYLPGAAGNEVGMHVAAAKSGDRYVVANERGTLRRLDPKVNQREAKRARVRERKRARPA